MKIRLDQVEKPFVWQENLEISATELDHPELVELGTVECHGSLRPMAEGFLFQATTSYQQQLRCMRCLSPVTVPLSSELELLLQVGSETPDPERELEAEELGLVFLEEPTFDTRPLLIEQVHLSIPMKTLCKEDCAGLCSGCGADLNSGPCDCSLAADPRWTALAALKGEE